jgi:hypothetical protein
MAAAIHEVDFTKVLIETWSCQERAPRRTAMDPYVGLDVSLKETSISVRQNGKRIWRGKCLSNPQLVAEMIRKHAPDAVLVVFETGPLATWFHRKLTADGLPAACIDARHAKAAHTAPNKMAVARASAACRLMMTAPGAGALAALSSTSMIEDPANFKNARPRPLAALRSGDIGADPHRIGERCDGA